jgi:hypothetical protein
MNKKIKIMSGWSAPGGSTVAFINLCNLFNENGYDCTFYGPHEWHLDKCKSGHLMEVPINEPEENLIVHYLKFPHRPEQSNKVILACHEKNVYPVKETQPFWDDVVYVSNSQMFWQGVPGKVIPNVVEKLYKPERVVFGIAAVIGSIDENKQTHVSIERAIKDGYKEIRLYGNITDEVYYNKYVKKYVDSHQASLMGHEDNKQRMYNSISKVYHSSNSETFNFIKAECEKTGTSYDGLDSAESGAETWTDKEILEAWEELLNG